MQGWKLSIDYDGILIVSFGGPEKREDVVPFLENVLRGKNVPHERMLEVAEHYYHFDGVSPLNQQIRGLITALQKELGDHGPQLPIYWGNRNWHPLLADTLRKMRGDGIKRALAFVTSAYSSYSGCRQYLEDIEQARLEVGSGAPQVDKLRAFFNHPAFVEAMVDRVRTALRQIPQDRHLSTQLVYTAHSIPDAMARGCDYAVQLVEVCQLVTQKVGASSSMLVYQSRSGPASQAWLEPDVCDHLRTIHAAGRYTDVVLVPIGFLSDHLEILFDLDTEARQLCEELGLGMVRANTVGTHPVFIGMIRELVQERIAGGERRSLGSLGPCHDVCPDDCCPSGRTIRPRQSKE